MDPQLALTGLRQALAEDAHVVTVADIDWDRYYPVFTSGRPTALFEDIGEVADLERRAVERPSGDSEFITRLRPMPADEQDRALLDLVRAEAAIALGHASPDVLSEQRAFRDVG
ncbi:beta-ketoacyl reductase, partial [Streptomyces cremeus]